jgi:hypothetical protein
MGKFLLIIVLSESVTPVDTYRSQEACLNAAEYAMPKQQLVVRSGRDPEKVSATAPFHLMDAYCVPAPKF